MPPTSPSQTEQRFDLELKHDQQLRWMFSIGASTISLSALAALFILAMAFGRTSPWLILLTLYSIATRALTFVSWKAFLYPRFLMHLDDPDPNVAAAAAAVFERHRPAVVRPILKDLLRDSDAPSIAAVDTRELASLARQHDVERRRRLGRRWLVAWCVLSLVIWGTVIATGGGPTD